MFSQTTKSSLEYLQFAFHIEGAYHALNRRAMDEDDQDEEPRRGAEVAVRRGGIEAGEMQIGTKRSSIPLDVLTEGYLWFLEYIHIHSSL